MMWSRQQLKAQAKMSMERSYWVSLGVCALAALLTGGWMAPRIGKFSTLPHIQWNGWKLSLHWDVNCFTSWIPFSSFFRNYGSLILAWTLILSAVGIVLGILYLVFVVGPVQVGQNRYFITARNSRCDFLQLFSPFFQPGFTNIVRTMASMYLQIWLWSLLFVIPGIVKLYACRMVPYILAENPGIPPRRAIQISEQAMQGEKFNTMILDISFLGWYILGALACGIGVFFVLPYIHATGTELYGVLRYKAISTGICHPAELSGRPL